MKKNKKKTPALNPVRTAGTHVETRVYTINVNGFFVLFIFFSPPLQMYSRIIINNDNLT